MSERYGTCTTCLGTGKREFYPDSAQCDCSFCTGTGFDGSAFDAEWLKSRERKDKPTAQEALEKAVLATKKALKVST